jgi:hypothetical protein
MEVIVHFSLQSIICDISYQISPKGKCLFLFPSLLSLSPSIFPPLSCPPQAAEKEWEERKQNMGHYDGREFERILDEAQANMMKGIPCREVPSEGEASAVTPATLEDQVNSPKPVAPTTGRESYFTKLPDTLNIFHY